MTYQSRLKKLRQVLQKEGCDSLIVEDPVNLYYLTGLDLSAGKLIVHSKGAHLLVDGRYVELCKKDSPYPVLVAEPPTFEQQLRLPELSHLTKLGFDTEKTSYKTHQQLLKIAKSISTDTSLARDLSLFPIDSPFKTLRAIKEKTEIDALRDAANLGSIGFDYVCSLLREGITEQECARELEIFWKRQGSKGVAFDPIIAFGPNSSMPHYRAGKTKLAKGDIILIDIGVNFNRYHSDMTRVAFFGKPDPALEKVHTIVQEAQQAALKLCKPGTTLGALDHAARSIIAAHGHGAHFTHSLGHGVGLDIHEYPTIRNAPPMDEVVLAPGMVVTIEPGIYLPGVGGVRIEDTIVITEDGHENLTKRTTDPKVVAD